MRAKKLYIVLASIGLVAVLAVAVYFIFNTQIRGGIDTLTKQTPPTFAFDEAQSNGWWASENQNPQTTIDENYMGDEPKEKLPVADRLIMQSKDTTVDSCFVMFSYYDYTINTQAERLRLEAAPTMGSNTLVVNMLGVQTETITTPVGEKSYELHSYAIGGEGSQQLQRGMAIGLVSMDDGYIKINAICPEGSQIASTLPAIKAMSLSR